MVSRPEARKLSTTTKQIEFTPSLKRNLRKLVRKYPSLREDLQTILDPLITGVLEGDLIPGIGYSVYKARFKNSDQKRGKRSGYRLIYLHVPPDRIILVTLYSKSDQSDISTKTIQRLIGEL